MWKVHVPPKSVLLIWILLHYRLPTWDRLQQKNLMGSGWFSLCKNSLETNVHLLCDCPFASQVWKDVEAVTNLLNMWVKGDVLENFTEWFVRRDLKLFRVLPWFFGAFGQ